MNIVLCAVNSKYVHLSLPVRCIREYARVQGIDCKVAEYTINEEFSKVLGDIYHRRPDVLAFSCYVWNISFIDRLCSSLKKIMPSLAIVLGGPEVSFKPEVELQKREYVDYIVSGEGEAAASLLFRRLLDGRRTSGIGGVAYRTEGGIEFVPPEGLLNMDQLPFPYTPEELSQKNRIFYYEASRGCPYGCTYCLSGPAQAVRQRDLETVKAEILAFINSGARLVKFVDRTFNCDPKRFREVLKFIYETGTNTGFHFEINAELLEDEDIRIISRFAPGQLRFEAGMQSANPLSLAAVHRKSDIARLCRGVKALSQETGAIVHLDLIAGLPYEDYGSFAASFNIALSAGPRELQLGFLKLLKGAAITSAQDKFGYRYIDFPPYEILCSKWIDYDDLLRLKAIEEAVELYYNSGAFCHSLDVLIPMFDTPFAFFEAVGSYLLSKGILRAPHSREMLYYILHDFCCESGLEGEAVCEALALDFMLNLRDVNLPAWAGGSKPPDFTAKCRRLLEDGSEALKLFEGAEGMPMRERRRRFGVEMACGKVWMIDYIDKKIQNVTKYFG